MRKDGRSINEQQAMLDLCCSHHTIEVTLTLLDLDMNEIPGGNISALLEDGQVTVDAEADVTRSLDLDLLDPTGALHLDSNSPSAGALFADRMIRVKYHVINPLGTVRYTTPLFTGPLTGLERNGAALKVECQGKEIFGLSEAWNGKSWKKGTRVTTIIKTIVRDMMGENHYNIPDLDRKTTRNVAVGGDSDNLPWPVAKALARSIGYLLYFDAMGVCQMKRLPSSSVFTFRQGPGGSVKSEPDVGFDIKDVINAVEVLGKKPTHKKGKPKKARPHAKAVAPRDHPFSPWKLGRKNGPRYIPLEIQDDSITTPAQARQRAKVELRRALLENVDVAYDALTIPVLEEADIVTLKTVKFTAKHRLNKFVFGLRSGSNCPIGYVQNVKPSVSSIRPGKKRATRKQRKKAH